MHVQDFYSIHCLPPGKFIHEPLHEKINNLGFRPRPTQTRPYTHRNRIEARKFRFRKKRHCKYYMYKAKAKALISCAQLLYCTADQQLCFRQCILFVFLRRLKTMVKCKLWWFIGGIVICNLSFYSLNNTFNSEHVRND